jgi:predicted acylesterase/phospholipase RssA/CRP-like cAMP-binding protein
VTDAWELSPLFDAVAPEAIDELAGQAVSRHYEAGEAVCLAGDPGTSLYLVERGLLHVLRPSDNALLVRQRPGHVLGEAASLTGEPRSATVLARVPSDVIELPRDAFLAVAERHPTLLANLARVAIQRLVARTTGRGPGDRRTAAVILEAEPIHAADVVAATRAASPNVVRGLDLTGARPRGSQALARLDEATRLPGTTLLLVRPGTADLGVLLDYADQVVALTEPAVAERIADTLRLPRGLVSHVAPNPARLSWLGRYLAGTRLGLALGAGGVKGFAHVGALRVLERAGYVVDRVAGSSMGAWVAAWLASGRRAGEIEQILRSSFDEDAVRAIYREGVVAGERRGASRLERLARATTGEARFEDLAVPLVVLTADLAGRRAAPISSGPVADALVAGMTVPGLYPPVRRGEQRLVDAVVLAPVPVRGLDPQAVDITVAINLLGRETLPAWPGAQVVPRRHRADRDVVVESLELASLSQAERQTALADVPVTPVFGPGTWRDIHLADHYLRAGEAAMTAALPALRALAGPA